MKMKRRTVSARFSLLVLAVLLASGCGQTATKGGPAKAAHLAQASKGEKPGDHSGWWCGEHGVPEEICGQCNAKVAAELKKKGDWCKEHDRPDSQCFICHPELKEHFAAQYRAKYGKEPPPVQEESRKEPREKCTLRRICNDSDHVIP